MRGTRFITSQQTFYDSGGFQAVASCPLVQVVWTRRKKLRIEEVDYAESGAQKSSRGVSAFGLNFNFCTGGDYVMLQFLSVKLSWII